MENILINSYTVKKFGKLKKSTKYRIKKNVFQKKNKCFFSSCYRTT